MGRRNGYMATTLTIELSDRLRSQELTREAAIPIRIEIETAWESLEKIVLDFENLGFTSVSFLDELVGKLFMQFTKEDVINKVQIIHLSQEDRMLLGNITNSRIRQKFTSLSLKWASS